MAFQAEPGRGRFPALQQHQQPGRHRARLQGERGLDHRRLVEPVGPQLRDAAARPAGRALYYIYAVDYDRGGEWSGQAFMCTRDKEFTIRGIDDCLARGFDRTGFFEVDTGEQPSWTVQLTESAEQAPLQPLQSRVPLVPAAADLRPRRRRREARTDATSAPDQDRRHARAVVVGAQRHREPVPRRRRRVPHQYEPHLA